MARGVKGTSSESVSWPQISARIEPALYQALVSHLRDPLLTTLPKGAVAGFLTIAIRNELSRRGMPCTAPSPTSSSASTSSTESGPATSLLSEHF